MQRRDLERLTRGSDLEESELPDLEPEAERVAPRRAGGSGRTIRDLPRPLYASDVQPLVREVLNEYAIEPGQAELAARAVAVALLERYALPRADPTVSRLPARPPGHRAKRTIRGESW